MDKNQTFISLVDYETDSDQEELPSVTITNDDFFHLDQDDQMLVCNLYENQPDETNTDETSSVSDRVGEETASESDSSSEQKFPMDSAADNIPASNPPKNHADKVNTDETCPVSRELVKTKETTSETNATQQSAGDSLAARHPPAKRKKYAVHEDQLSPSMIALLRKVKEFFVRPTSLERITSPVASSTIDKASERIRCYLGFVARHKSIDAHELEDLGVFSDSELIQSYLDYLHDCRELRAATTACHISSILYVLKYLHKQKAPKYDVKIINQLRGVATSLQRQGEVERPKTTKELRALNKWLSWEEILEAVELQRQKFDIARGKEKAVQMRDLLLLTIYCHLPPSRGLEIRTLRYFQEVTDSKFCLDNHKGANVLVSHITGEYTFHFQDYKTKKFGGHDELSLELGTELNRLLKDYFANYRKPLASEASKDFVFMYGPVFIEHAECDKLVEREKFLNNSCGSPYTASCFTKHLQTVFVKLTGQTISINALRSSFITYAYANANCSESMKDSLAAALRHSRKQAQNVYDRRTMAEKKDEAVAFARNLAESPSAPSVSAAETDQTARNGKEESKFVAGEFVSVVEQESTLSDPKILIGRILYFTKPGEEVSLLHYQNIKANNYALAVDGSCWLENVNSLVSVKMSASNKFPDQYVLKTSRRAIHKQVFQ